MHSLPEWGSTSVLFCFALPAIPGNNFGLRALHGGSPGNSFVLGVEGFVRRSFYLIFIEAIFSLFSQSKVSRL
jgi:hypothetical protein